MLAHVPCTSLILCGASRFFRLFFCTSMQHFLHILCPQFLFAHLRHPSVAQLTFLCFFARTKWFPSFLHWYSWKGLSGQFFIWSNFSLPLAAIVPLVKLMFPRENETSYSSIWKALYAIRTQVFTPYSSMLIVFTGWIFLRSWSWKRNVQKHGKAWINSFMLPDVKSISMQDAVMLMSLFAKNVFGSCIWWFVRALLRPWAKKGNKWLQNPNNLWVAPPLQPA